MTNTLDRSAPNTELSEQEILNKSFDKKYDLLAFLLIGEYGNTTKRLKVGPDGSLSLGDFAVQLIKDGTDMYIGEAPVGSALGSAVWRIKKLDMSNGLSIKYADGNANFDNVWNNYAGLSYS